MIEDTGVYEALGIMNASVRDYRKEIRGSELVDTINCDYLYGVVLGENGEFSSKVKLENNLQNISLFICSNQKDKLILNPEDNIVLNTLGIYIDLCADKVFLDELRPVLIRIQKRNCIREEVRIID